MFTSFLFCFILMYFLAFLAMKTFFSRKEKPVGSKEILCQAGCLTHRLAVTAGFSERLWIIMDLAWGSGSGLVEWCGAVSCAHSWQLPPLPWYSALILPGLRGNLWDAGYHFGGSLVAESEEAWRVSHSQPAEWSHLMDEISSQALAGNRNFCLSPSGECWGLQKAVGAQTSAALSMLFTWSSPWLGLVSEAANLDYWNEDIRDPLTGSACRWCDRACVLHPHLPP